jgi:hypothetical protein
MNVEEATTTETKAEDVEAAIDNSEEVQLNSDPICSSAGCTEYKLPDDGPKYPMDYFVPNFGVDSNIL